MVPGIRCRRAGSAAHRLDLAHLWSELLLLVLALSAAGWQVVLPALYTVTLPACLLSEHAACVAPYLPAVAFVSLAWTVIISVMRGALEQDAVAAVAAPTPQELNQQHAAVAASAAVAATAVAAAGGSGGGATGHAMHASAASLSDVMEGGVGLKGLVATPSVAEAQT